MASLEGLWSGVATSFVDNTQQSIVFAAIATLLVVILTTRALSGSPTTSERSGSQKVPSRPGHWLPFVGNAPWMALDTSGYLARMRERYPEGIFSLKMMGNTHHFIHKPSLATALLKMQQPAAEEQMIANHILESTFGVRKEDQALYNQTLPDAQAQYQHLLAEPGLSEITNTTLSHIKQHIPDFITFNDSPADQTHWERLANADVIENANANGDAFVEADLMELTRNFVAKTASPAIFGTDFVENFPDIWKFFWAFDEAFILMAANVPAWLPWPRLQRGKLARRRILACTYEFEEALEKHLDGEDPGERWQELDNVGRLVKGRAEQFRKHGISLRGRASLDLALLWATSANANQLVSWMLFEIYRDPVLLQQIREEIAPCVEAVQPKNDFGPGVWISAKLKDVDIDGLVTKCPLLKAAYVETLRVYTGVWSMKWMYHDMLLEERGKEGEESYFLKKGTYAHIPQEMHQLDPNYFANPNEWQVKRHIKEVVDENGKMARVADLGSIRPYGSGARMCKGRHFALREMLLYTAVIISFYDMQPPKGGSWKIPETVNSVGTRRAKRPIRVWIKRRELPEEEDT